jgi:hypothetical protein
MDYRALKNAANTFWDVQQFRVAMENRAGSGTVDPGYVAFASERYREIEDKVSGIMIEELKRCAPQSIRDWAARTPGIGRTADPHTLAKLLGMIGDPYIATPQHWVERPGAKGGKADPKRVLVDDPPYVRNLAKLWAYCGYGDPARRRYKKMPEADAAACGKWKAKATLRTMALLAVQSGKRHPSRYRAVYDGARERYADRVHDRPCPQCKGSSQPGQPWKDGHQHAAALRLVAKEILRDLWEMSRDAHQAGQEAA